MTAENVLKYCSSSEITQKFSRPFSRTSNAMFSGCSMMTVSPFSMFNAKRWNGTARTRRCT